MTRAARAGLWRDLAGLLRPSATDGRIADAGRERDWLGLYRLATDHLVAPTLYASLCEHKAWSGCPDAIRQALDTLHQLNEQRNRCLRNILRDTIRCLNRAGIEPVLLKGAVALLPDQYPYAEARMLGDLDLAVKGAPPVVAARALLAAGYRCAPPDALAGWPGGHHHLPPLIHPSGGGHVEIHLALFSATRVHREALPMRSLLDRARSLDWEGLRLWIPAPEDRLLHNMLHHQLQDGAYRNGWRALRQVLEFVRLREHGEVDRVDWPAWLRQLHAVDAGDAMLSYLLTASALFGQSLPPGIEVTAAARRAERRFWFRVGYPRAGRLLDAAFHYGRRLANLPRRLLTPSWYPEKYRHLRDTFAARRGEGGPP